jgi:hypothetical protein
MIAAFEDGNLSLPFGGLISHIFAHLGIEPEEGEPVITSIASFDKRTISKSSGQVDRHIRRQAAAKIQTLQEHPLIALHPFLKMLCP